MRRKGYIKFVRGTLVMLFFGALFSQCATIMTPQGGPKDTLPPVIVGMRPDNFTTNFKGNKIFIEFNEFVQIKNQAKEFYTSPAMKKLPLLSTRGKGVVVTLRDTLRENQTYVLDFGSAICDNNESNPLNAMRYVFSTGDRVDSIMCSGYTADSYTADSVSRTFIWFFIADSLPDTPDWDSTIFNRKPDAIARAQNNGIFIAQNLKPVPYRIYAFGDKNDNMMYEPGTDMVGILDGTYNPATLPDFAIWFDSLRMYPSAEPQLYFRMFTDKPFKNQRLVEAVRPLQKKAMLYFNTANPQIENIVLDSIPSDKILLDPQTRGKDTVAVWFNVPAENLPDTLKGEITYYRHDSVRQYVKTTEPLKLAWKLVESKEQQREREKEEKEREKALKEGREYTPPAKPNPFKCTFSAQGEFNPEKGLSMTFDSPAVKFDSLKVLLTTVDASGEETPVTRHFVRDTLNMSKWEINAAWKPATKYRLFIPSGAITDISGYENDTIKVDISSFDPEKFATLTLRVVGEPGKQYIIQQTDSSGRTQQEVKNVRSGIYRIKYIPAGEIRIRVIEDTNLNGQWDAGDVVNRLQPERAEMYINERGEDLFVTKVNWEIETTLNMEDIFVPMTMENIVKIIDDKEASRLKKLAEEWEKKRGTDQHKDEHSQGQSGGFGFGGAMGGMGGLKNIGSGMMQNNSGNQMIQ